jgi:type IV pilus assembly protein PilW
MGGAESLVDNVDDMKFWYGEAKPIVNPDDIINPDFRRAVRYVSAANVSDWNRVVSVRICLLMRSGEPVFDTELTATPTYLDCDSAQQNLPDRYLRRAYFTTTTLRNRMAF